jgi:GT2 family glycosyltransferase
MPEAQLILNKGNDGFAKGNNDGMRAALADGCDYVILFNLDTVVDSACVRLLAEEMDRDASTAALQARLMLWPEKGLINTLGNASHYLGFGFGLHYRREYDASLLPPDRRISYASGAAVIYRASALADIGLFDEEYWMYNEDQEICWRAWLAGYACRVSEAAVCYHKYEFSRSTSKMYWMDRNRLLTFFKYYRWPTILLFLPPLLLMEAGTAYFSRRSGWWNEKKKVWVYFARMGTWRYLAAERRRNRRLRRTGDAVLIDLLSGRIEHQEVESKALAVANIFFDYYFRLIKAVCIW